MIARWTPAEENAGSTSRGDFWYHSGLQQKRTPTVLAKETSDSTLGSSRRDLHSVLRPQCRGTRGFGPTGQVLMAGVQLVSRSPRQAAKLLSLNAGRRSHDGPRTKHPKPANLSHSYFALSSLLPNSDEEAGVNYKRERERDFAPTLGKRERQYLGDLWHV